jgi:spore protease
VLVVGLGNREITSDAIGPKTADKLTVTRHIKYADEDVWNELDMCEVSALSPGVLGQTGIETVELVRGAVENVRPQLVLAVDALAARSSSRLAATVQLCDSGIAPGSGVGNERGAICLETVGAPVVALGVPTVVDSSTLVYDALAQAGIEQVDERLREILENGRRFYVSPKEADVIAERTAAIIAHAINRALVGVAGLA